MVALVAMAPRSYGRAVASDMSGESEVCHSSCGRKTTRSATVTSTCSTACTDWESEQSEQSESGGSSPDGEAWLAGQVWKLSQDPRGTHQVQAALVAAASDEAREALAAELRGHVAKAMRCPHANHVLQRCIALMRPEALQFIVDELLARSGLAVQAAKHRYACRIVQHTLSKCPASQTAELVEHLLRDAKALACHTIGHYTVELVLEVGTEDQRYRLVRTIERNVRSIGLSPSGGAMVRSTLAYAALEDKVWIARAVLQEPEVLLSLATDRHGSIAVVQVLRALQIQERARAREVLLQNLEAVQHLEATGSSKFGQVLAEHLLSVSSDV